MSVWGHDDQQYRREREREKQINSQPVSILNVAIPCSYPPDICCPLSTLLSVRQAVKYEHVALKNTNDSTRYSGTTMVTLFTAGEK